MPKVKVAIRSEVKLCLKLCCSTTEANLMKIHRKLKHNEKVCCIHDYIYVPKLKVKVTIWGQSSKYVSAITQNNTKANFIKLHRKTRYHERYAMHHRGLRLSNFFALLNNH